MSLAVYDDPADRHFYCYGCRMAGDAFAAVQALDRCDFRTAVEGLAAVADVDVARRAAAAPVRLVASTGAAGFEYIRGRVVS